MGSARGSIRNCSLRNLPRQEALFSRLSIINTGMTAMVTRAGATFRSMNLRRSAQQQEVLSMSKMSQP